MLKTKRYKLQYFFLKSSIFFPTELPETKHLLTTHTIAFCKKHFRNSLASGNFYLFVFRKTGFVILITAEPINFNILKKHSCTRNRENFVTIGLPCLDSTFFPSQAPDCLKDHLYSIQIYFSWELYSQLCFILFSISQHNSRRKRLGTLWCSSHHCLKQCLLLDIHRKTLFCQFKVRNWPPPETQEDYFRMVKVNDSL